MTKRNEAARALTDARYRPRVVRDRSKFDKKRARQNEKKMAKRVDTAREMSCHA